MSEVLIEVPPKMSNASPEGFIVSSTKLHTPSHEGLIVLSAKLCITFPKGLRSYELTKFSFEGLRVPSSGIRHINHGQEVRPKSSLRNLVIFLV